jgi:hypothetical protein
VKRGALGVIVVIACLIAAVCLMSPRVVTETITRSGHADLPDEPLWQTLYSLPPSYRPDQPLR